jgi:1,4-alpha-glucan branching enzyme
MTPELDLSLRAILNASSSDPFAVLGPHVSRTAGRSRLTIRTFQPRASAVLVVPADAGVAERAMTVLHPDGLFEAVYEDVDTPFAYRLRVVRRDDGVEREIVDPYTFDLLLGELDLHLLAEGRHLQLHRCLGAQPMTIDGVAGTRFAVWAPNAQRVSVVGDFNEWDGRVHPMRQRHPRGVWEIFLPDVGAGARYKYEIRSRAAEAPFVKADPCGAAYEHPPATASLVTARSGYDWKDQAWVAEREAHREALGRPMAIYEVHLGSWARREDGTFLNYRELADRLIPYVSDLGFTHVELLPVLEFPYDGSWGYQVIGFFAPTSRFGTPDDFRAFVDALHNAGLGVILDWVPGHFPKDAHGLARFDGTALYEHEDPRQGEHRDWGTLIFNYGRTEVRNFLTASALAWIEDFHLDGLRVDAVASMLYLDYSREPGEWLPNAFGGRENLDAVSFLQELNALVHSRHPGVVTIAEESTAWPGVSRPVHLGGLGFTYKWNMGWMHDILTYMSKEPIFRRWEHNHLTFSMLYAYNENFILPFSHDEVVHGKRSLLDKMPGDTWQKAANLRALFAYMVAHPGKKLLFQGAEFGQWREWNHDEEMPWFLLGHPPHDGIHRFVRDLLHLYRREPALFECDYDPAGFAWIDCNDNENSIVSFVRKAANPDNQLIVVLNLTPVPRHGYRIGVPFGGTYREVLNSDAALYGGSNVCNAGQVPTSATAAHGFAQSIVVTLPPLACLILKHQGEA